MVASALRAGMTIETGGSPQGLRRGPDDGPRDAAVARVPGGRSSSHGGGGPRVRTNRDQKIV